MEALSPLMMGSPSVMKNLATKKSRQRFIKNTRNSIFRKVVIQSISFFISRSDTSNDDYTVTLVSRTAQVPLRESLGQTRPVLLSLAIFQHGV